MLCVMKIIFLNTLQSFKLSRYTFILCCSDSGMDVGHGYGSIFVSFFIYLKDRSVIQMSEYVSDTDTFGKMKSPCN